MVTLHKTNELMANLQADKRCQTELTIFQNAVRLSSRGECEAAIEAMSQVAMLLLLKLRDKNGVDPR